jgi:hypothetical protein
MIGRPARAWPAVPTKAARRQAEYASAKRIEKAAGAGEDPSETFRFLRAKL